MVKAGEGVLGCAHPVRVCDTLDTGEAGAAKQGYCGLSYRVTREPYLALTGFRRR